MLSHSCSQMGLEMIHDSVRRQHNDARINGVSPKPADASTQMPTPTPAASSMRRTLPDICFEIRNKIDAFLCEETDDDVLRKVQNQVRVSIDVIGEALRRYGLEHVSLSYNGGKDCLVLLVLIMACLPAWASSSRPSPPDFDVTTMSTPPQAPTSESAVSSNAAPTTRPLQAIYIVSPHPFAEVEDFVCSSAEQYHLDLKRYALPMRPALEAYLKDRPAVKAIFLGTRRTDPHGEFLSHFNPTDEGWPQFMRVHPVIDWHYVEIWAFIRHLGIPFCELYNRGFTSLGGVTDTRPNPALAVRGEASKFRPAYELRDDDEERLGRD